MRAWTYQEAERTLGQCQRRNNDRGEPPFVWRQDGVVIACGYAAEAWRQARVMLSPDADRGRTTFEGASAERLMLLGTVAGAGTEVESDLRTAAG